MVAGFILRSTMDAKDKIDMALRAGLISKVTLKLINCGNPHLCRLIFIEMIKQIKELDKKLESFGV